MKKPLTFENAFKHGFQLGPGGVNVFHQAGDDWRRGWGPGSGRLPRTLSVADQDLDRSRQWFDIVEDTNPALLDAEDYRVAYEIYLQLGQRPSHRLADRAGMPRVEPSEETS